MIAAIGQKGRVTIPGTIRQEAQLEVGDSLDVEVVPEGILLRSRTTGDDPAAFWGPQWNEDLAEAWADVERGHTTFHESTEDF